MGDLYASTPSGSRSGSTYGISDPYRGSEADAFMARQGQIADRMNRSSAASGGGGGGGGGRSPLLQSPSGSFYDPFAQSWNLSPDGARENEKQGMASQHWNQVWGALSPLISGFGKGSPYTVGGDSGAGPEISVGGVYNPQQINQQVNAARAGNDSATAARIRDSQQQMASRGFGSDSPLLMALTNSYQNQNLATNADTERNIRQNASEANAKQVLSTQQAREGQYASRQNEGIERAKPYFGTMNTLLGALAGLA